MVHQWGTKNMFGNGFFLFYVYMAWHTYERFVAAHRELKVGIIYDIIIFINYLCCFERKFSEA